MATSGAVTGNVIMKGEGRAQSARTTGAVTHARSTQDSSSEQPLAHNPIVERKSSTSRFLTQQSIGARARRKDFITKDDNFMDIDTFDIQTEETPRFVMPRGRNKKVRFSRSKTHKKSATHKTASTFAHWVAGWSFLMSSFISVLGIISLAFIALSVVISTFEETPLIGPVITLIKNLVGIVSTLLTGSSDTISFMTFGLAFWAAAAVFALLVWASILPFYRVTKGGRGGNILSQAGFVMAFIASVMLVTNIFFPIFIWAFFTNFKELAKGGSSVVLKH